MENKEIIAQLESLIDNSKSFITTNDDNDDYTQIWKDDIVALTAAIDIIRSSEWIPVKDKLPARDNMWYGTTATTPDEQFFWGGAWHTFVSIEPILRDYSSEIGHMCDTFAQWVIIGAETGKRKGKVIPEREWIRAIVQECYDSCITVFMKDSLIPIVGEEYMIRQIPWIDGIEKDKAAIERWQSEFVYGE